MIVEGYLAEGISREGNSDFGTDAAQESRCLTPTIYFAGELYLFYIHIDHNCFILTSLDVALSISSIYERSVYYY